MIKGDFTHCENIVQFYSEIRTLHEEAHGKEYVAHHDEMSRLAKECTSYRELGTMQGATAAALAVAGIPYIQLVDITFEKFRPYQHLFKDINLEMHEISSIDPSLSSLKPVDMMLVDSVHVGAYTLKELALHAKSVRKYIVFHDTVKPTDDIQKAIMQFLKQNTNWTLETVYTQNVGFTTIRRVL